MASGQLDVDIGRGSAHLSYQGGCSNPFSISLRDCRFDSVERVDTDEVSEIRRLARALDQLADFWDEHEKVQS